MLSRIPQDLTKVPEEQLNTEILDASSLYEQLAAMTDKEDIKKVLLDIAKEEKTHMGEFQALLLKYDPEQVKELEAGKKEVEELTG